MWYIYDTDFHPSNQRFLCYALLKGYQYCHYFPHANQSIEYIFLKLRIHIIPLHFPALTFSSFVVNVRNNRSILKKKKSIETICGCPCISSEILFAHKKSVFYVVMPVCETLAVTIHWAMRSNHLEFIQCERHAFLHHFLTNGKKRANIKRRRNFLEWNLTIVKFNVRNRFVKKKIGWKGHICVADMKAVQLCKCQVFEHDGNEMAPMCVDSVWIY